MRLHGVARILCAFQRPHARHRREDLVLTIVPQVLEHLDVLTLRAGLLQNLAEVANNDGVGGDDQRGLTLLLVVNLLLVHRHRLLRRSLEHIFEGSEALGQVLRKRRRDDFEIAEADLQEHSTLVLATWLQKTSFAKVFVAISHVANSHGGFSTAAGERGEGGTTHLSEQLSPSWRTRGQDDSLAAQIAQGGELEGQRCAWLSGSRWCWSPAGDGGGLFVDGIIGGRRLGGCGFVIAAVVVVERHGESAEHWCWFPGDFPCPA